MQFNAVNNSGFYVPQKHVISSEYVSLWWKQLGLSFVALGKEDLISERYNLTNIQFIIFI